MGEVKSLSHTHHAIMDYMMANPMIALGDVAKHFGYTQPWLSQIIHSDAFQVMLQEKQGTAFHHTVLSVREKIAAVANIALDGLVKQLATEAETKTLHEVASDFLDKMGYSSKPIGSGGGNVTVNQQNNMIIPSANAAEIAAARAMLEARKNPALGVQVDGVSIPLALPRTSTTKVGETVTEGDFSPAGGQDAAGEGRAQV